MEWLVYALLGAVAGTLAGLLGIGGGLVMVPVLVLWLPLAGVGDDQLLHVALATALASIIPTSIASARSHHRRGAVQWPLLIALAPAVALGALVGAQFAAALSSTLLQIGVALFCQLAALQMLLGRPSAQHDAPPTRGILAIWGLGIGVLSALVGIGGGSLTVPLLIAYGIAPVRAIATSAACGLPIALAGSLGFVWAGKGELGLPEASLGYVYLPAVAGIALFSVMTAPLGVRLAHWLPATTLKRVFALVLSATGLWLGWDAIAA